MRALPALVLPGKTVHAVLHRPLHDAVIGGMEFHVIDPAPVGIEGLKLRPVLVGDIAQGQQLAADHLTVISQMVFGPATTLAGNRLAQGHVRLPGIVIVQCLRLVFDRVGTEGVVSGHNKLPVMSVRLTRADSRQYRGYPIRTMKLGSMLLYKPRHYFALSAPAGRTTSARQNRPNCQCPYLSDKHQYNAHTRH